MSNIDAINEAAEKEFPIVLHIKGSKVDESILAYQYAKQVGFKAGALSDAAKQFWFEQFKAEQKQTIVTDLPAPPWDDCVTHNLDIKVISKDDTKL